MPTPAPMPAFAPVDSPPLLVDWLEDAATEGVLPGVLVNVYGSTTVVAGMEAITTEVRVVYPGTPLLVVGRTSVTYDVLVE